MFSKQMIKVCLYITLSIKYLHPGENLLKNRARISEGRHRTSHKSPRHPE